MFVLILISHCTATASATALKSLKTEMSNLDQMMTHWVLLSLKGVNILCYNFWVCFFGSKNNNMSTSTLGFSIETLHCSYNQCQPLRLSVVLMLWQIRSVFKKYFTYIKLLNWSSLHLKILNTPPAHMHTLSGHFAREVSSCPWEVSQYWSAAG